jgi:hypothetical protein
MVEGRLSEELINEALMETDYMLVLTHEQIDSTLSDATEQALTLLPKNDITVASKPKRLLTLGWPFLEKGPKSWQSLDHNSHWVLPSGVLSSD